MRKLVVGLFLLLHGLAHAAAGMSAQDAPRGIAAALGREPRIVLATLLFVIVTPGFVVGGLGHWGVVGFRRFWAPATRLAVLGSILFFTLFTRSSAEVVPALVLDAVALFVADAPWQLWTRARSAQ